VWKPPERPKDPETDQVCSIVHEGTIWKPPEPPKDPNTGTTCSIVVNGTVWVPPENPPDELREDPGELIWKPKQREK